MAVAATGFFDGVHLGHQAVIKTLLDCASRHGGQSLVISFWPHPRVFLQNGARELCLLCSQEEKLSLLSAFGVDKVEIMPFSSDFAALDARAYLTMLRDNYGVGCIVLGYDNRFGSDGLDTMQIASLAREMGFEVEVVEHATVDGEVVSSTKIRKLLQAGDVSLAGRMLGYGYSLTGVVVAGKQMGRTIGFPTANLQLREPLKCVPAAGVYLSEVQVKGRTYFGMSNIDSVRRIETHILDFDEDIYGLDIKVSFIDRIRDEMHFNSFDELKIQLELDRMSVKNRIFAADEKR